MEDIVKIAKNHALILLLLINLLPAEIIAQSDLKKSEQDSLWQIWSNPQQPDTSRLNAINYIIVYGYLYSNSDSAYQLAQLEYAFAKARGLKKYQAKSLSGQGGASRLLGEYERSRQHYLKSLKLYEELKDKKGIANALCHVGTVEHEQGNFIQAFEFYRKGLLAHQQSGDEIGKANVLSNIGILFQQTSQDDSSIFYLNQGYEIFAALNNPRGMSATLGSMGDVFKHRGDHSRAIDYFMKSLKIDEENKDNYGIGYNLNDIGILYEIQKDYAKAIEFYNASMLVKEKISDKPGIALIKNNLGHLYRLMKDYELSVKYLNESLALREEMKDKPGISNTLGNLGLVYEDMLQPEVAKSFLYRGLQLQIEMEDNLGIASTQTILARIYFSQNDTQKALNYANEALTLSQQSGNPEEIGKAAEILYKVYKHKDDYSNALKMHKLHRLMRDSIMSEENQKELLRHQFRYDYDKKESLLKAEQESKDAIAKEEIRRKNLERNAFIGGFAFMLLLSYVFISQRKRIAVEKKHSDELLLNILPFETAEELKATGTAKARHFDQVTVLFTDFTDFAEQSERLDPEELVSLVNDCFSAFDRIMAKHGVEKIKTIGDAYMAAGGLPTSNNTHPDDVIRAALEIQAFMSEFRASHRIAFEIRIGINTGPVVAGIVGIKKFQYDIWGDTVNTASRMESSGEVGKVNISENTYELVKHQFACTYRGEIEAKGKGKIKMYFVDMPKG